MSSSRKKRLALWLLTGAACLLSTGCLDLQMRVALDKSGTARTELKLEMLDQLFQNLSFFLNQSGADMSLLERAPLEAYLDKRNGSLGKFENQVENGIRTIHIRASVPNGKAWLDEVGGGQMTFSEEEGATVLRVLESGLGDSLAGMDNAMLEQQLAVLMPQMSGLRLNLVFEVPELLETNLQQNGNEARLNLDFDADIASQPKDQAAAAFRELIGPKFIKFR